MGKTKGLWIFLIISSLILSCNSPKRQKKINDGKLFEKLKQKEGYLNSLELKRLDYNFSLKALDKYDFSGFDEEDTLAYFVRSGPYLWIASCYLGEDDNPFFCLKEEKERRFKLIRKGIIPVVYGECSYELENLLVSEGKYIFVSQKSDGSGYCDDSPLVFHPDGKELKTPDDQFRIITQSSWDEESILFKRYFNFLTDNPEQLLIQVHEKKFNWETEEEVGYKSYDLRFLIRNNTIYFRDTIFK